MSRFYIKSILKDNFLTEIFQFHFSKVWEIRCLNYASNIYWYLGVIFFLVIINWVTIISMTLLSMIRILVWFLYLTYIFSENYKILLLYLNQFPIKNSFCCICFILYILPLTVLRNITISVNWELQNHA